MASNHKDPLRKIDDLLDAAAKLNKIFPDVVLVGGTAAAIHARHRLSTDADFILPDLSNNFDTVFTTMDNLSEWELARTRPSVVIMGNFNGVETTLRQLIRTRPLETEKIQTPSGTVNIPTLEEMIRVKAWLALTRNAYRDYLDLAALTDVAGEDRTFNSLVDFDSYYSDIDRNQIVRNVSPLLQLMRQLFEPKPHDLTKKNEVERYKAVSDKWKNPEDVLATSKKVGFLLADRVFSMNPDIENDLETVSKNKRPDLPKAEMPAFPEATHEAHVSKDGSVIVIRMKKTDENPHSKVDNPLGPAVVSSEGGRYALDGRFMTEEAWREHVASAPRSGLPPGS